MDDYVSIYRLMVVYKKHNNNHILSSDRLYNLTLRLKYRIENIITKKKLNDSSFLLLKKQLDECLVEYENSNIVYNENKYIETLISIGQNLQKFVKYGL